MSGRRSARGQTDVSRLDPVDPLRARQQHRGCRTARPPPGRRFRDLPGRRPAREDRSCVDGALARGPRPVPTRSWRVSPRHSSPGSRSAACARSAAAQGRRAAPPPPDRLRTKAGLLDSGRGQLRGELEPFARDVLSAETLRRQAFFESSSVTRLLDRHVAGEETSHGSSGAPGLHAVVRAPRGAGSGPAARATTRDRRLTARSHVPGASPSEASARAAQCTAHGAQALLAKHPAASGVRLCRSPAPPGEAAGQGRERPTAFGASGYPRTDLRRKPAAGSSRREDRDRHGLAEPGEVADEPGTRYVLHDYEDEPVAIVEVTEAQILPVSKIDLQFARDEGEGFESVEDRAAHERFFNRNSSPTRRSLRHDWSSSGCGDPSTSPPAHVLVFRPLIRILRDRGAEVEVTARSYAQTLELLELHGIEAEVFGRHGGRSRLGKARALTSRLGAPRRWASGFLRFDRALAHGSHELDDHRPPARSRARRPSTTSSRGSSTSSACACRDARRRPRGNPARPAGALRRAAPEAEAVRRAEGGVLPGRLRARPVGGRSARSIPTIRSWSCGHRLTSSLSPLPLESALPARARTSRRQ